MSRDVTIRDDASRLAHRLGREAEAVCRHYLGAGQRFGHYWQVGDVHNTPGRSMFVRLQDSRKGPAGKWQDAATGEHGDLLDVIRETCGLIAFSDVLHEARAFLSLPRPEMAHMQPGRSKKPAQVGSAESARRLYAMAKPLQNTLAQTYLHHRGIDDLSGTGASLRFHPRCYHVPEDGSPRQVWPALIAAVTNDKGQITGVHRTWLALDGKGKAPVLPKRKSMGDLLGNAVRFGRLHDDALNVMAAGEGIETVLALRQILPTMPMCAALSANHLAALEFRPHLRRLYIVHDRDPSGRFAKDRLLARACHSGIEAIVLEPQCGDFNEDLLASGIDALRANMRPQISPEDVVRFMHGPANGSTGLSCQN